MKSKMRTVFFLFCIYTTLSFKEVFSYKIPNAQLDILQNGFRVSIPDEEGIKNVCFVMERPGLCPTIMDYISEPKNGRWVSEQLDNTLDAADEMVIKLLVQHENGVFESTDYIKANNITALSVSIRTADYGNDSTGECFTEGNNIEFWLEKSCKVAQTTVRNAIALCHGDVLFEETFDNTANLNQNIWSFDIRNGLNHLETEEFVLYNDSATNCYVKDGFLHIVPTISTTDIRTGVIDLGDKCTALNYFADECKIEATGFYSKVLPPVYSALVHTRKSFRFKFGRVEIRAKLPKGDWLIPYLALQSATLSSPVHKVPQIRIAFTRGNEHLMTEQNIDEGGTRLYGGIIFWDNNDRILHLRYTQNDSHFGDDFHVYSLTWKETGITVSVDGLPYGEITEDMEHFREEFFLMLGVSVGGHLEFADVGPVKPWINTSPKAPLNFWKKRDDWAKTWNGSEMMKVDYVRIYAT